MNPKNPQAVQVLIVEDDRELAQLIATELQAGGFQTVLAANGFDAFECLSQQAIELVLLDLMLPGEDGLELCRRFQQLHPSPSVIMVTARDHLADRVAGLELGADDYVVKPFEPRELLARCKAVLRRRTLIETNVAMPTTKPRHYHFLGWRLDVPVRQLSSPSGVVYSLPNSDFNVLLALIQSPNQVLSRSRLLKHAFSRSMSYEDRAIDVCISRLRQYLEKDRSRPELIRTLRNEGYVLTLDAQQIRAA